jgi:hypothetical protein
VARLRSRALLSWNGRDGRSPPRGVRLLAGAIEDVLVIVIAAAATLRAEWKLVANPLTVQPDAQIHEFWMRKFQDPALFHDRLTDALLATGYEPPGFQFVYWVASHVVDPVFFGELLPLVLQPLAVWLVYRIVREHTDWRPAAWTAAALFLVPWDIHRFSGGHPRAFAEPIVLLAVFLLVRRRNAAAALVPPVGMLLYPPAGLAALVVVLLATFERRQRFLLNRERVPWAAASSIGVAVAILIPRLLTNASERLITEAEARRYPEFGPHGQMHFFAASLLRYLKQNYSGFALRDSGSILAVAALVLLLVRVRNAWLLRWEVWCMPIAALALYGVAQAVLFRLYLPHRYTYPLLPFFCIAIGVALRPTLEALASRSRILAWVAAPIGALGAAAVALTVFPLGPQLSFSQLGSWFANAGARLALGLACGALLAAVIWFRRPREQALTVAAASAAVVAAGVLFAEVAVAGGGTSTSTVCRERALYRYLSTLPKDAVIAGDPRTMNCVPLAARRPVLISTKLYQPWNVAYFKLIRPRMFALVNALYGSSPEAVVKLRTVYGADYFVVDAKPRTRPWGRMAPFTGEMKRLLESGQTPAARRLPDECVTWRRASATVYSLECVAATQPP